ncbi:MAG: squalene--hopene cyclase [Planctomycetota bacterium]|nr:MAG: squalene--hopene cyclase [Planctomycetota bacterium]
MIAADFSLAYSIELPRPWIIAWAVLALLSCALVALLRTRLQRLKPWQKCAILSLWVHVLLGCLIGAVQIARGGPGAGDGYGPPIAVTLLAGDLDATATQPLASASTPPAAEDEELNAAPAQQAEMDPAAAEPDPLDAPELVAQPAPAAPEPAAEPEATEPDAPHLADLDDPPSAHAISDQTAVTPPPDAAAVQPPEDEAAVPPLVAAQQPAASEDAAPTPLAADVAPAESAADGQVAVAAAAPAPAPFAARFAPNRTAIAEAGGGGANTERAVARGLAWLASAQEQDGRWDPRRHGAGRELYVLQQNRGGAGAKADTGISALALLAFLGAGQTHRHGPYAMCVGPGLEYLCRSQRPDGSLAGQAEMFAQMYCHSMASFALAEALAMTDDERLRPALVAGVGYSLAVQHPTNGGWRYRPGDTGDTSQLGWQVMALRSAEQGGLTVPPVTWNRVDRFLQQVVRGQAGGLAVYRPEEARPSRPMTAEALYCRQLVTGRADGGLSPAALAEALDSLVGDPPSQRAVNLYYWYYASLALHRAQHVSSQAAAAWRTWNDALTQTLLALQREDGCWPETCLWGGYGGRVYTTALATMCLEVYYRYVPPDEPPSGVARQRDWRDAVPR